MSRNLFLKSFLAAASMFSLGSCSSTSSKLKIIHFDQTILGDSAKDLGVSIGVKKGNSTLLNEVNNALASLSQDTRNQLMTEATYRSNGDYSTSTLKYTVPTNSEKTIKIGLECNYAPFNWTDVSDNDYNYPIKGTNQYADGYDIQVASYLASTLGYNLEIVKLEWESLIPSLNTDTIDLVIAGMTDTEERRQSIDFTNEYYRSELVLVVREDSKYANATSLSDFAGAKIVSQVSTVTDDVINSWTTTYNVEHLNALDTFATCALAVQNNTADAMTAELPVATSIVNGSN